MKQKIKDIIADISGFDAQDITDDINLFEEQILDSFGVVRLVVELQNVLGVSLNIATIERTDIDTIDKLAQLAGAKS